MGRERVVLGELLDELSRQADLPLRLHKNDEWASGIPMVVSLRDRKLTEVMEAMETLFTHRNNSAEWQPAPEGQKGLVLRFGRTAAAAAAVAQAELLNDVRRQARDLYRLCRLPRDARLQALAGARLAVPSRAMEPVAELLANMTPEELDAALQGAEVRIPWDRVSPAGRAASNLGVTQGGEPRDAPRTGPISFRIEPHHRMLAPAFWVSNALGQSTNLIGGYLLDDAWLRDRADGWLLPGDPEARAVTEAAVKSRDKIRRLPAGDLRAWVTGLSTRFDRDIIAEFDHEDFKGRYGTAGTLEEWGESLRYLVFQTRVMAKEQGSLTLIRSVRSLISARADTVSWPVRRATERVVDENQGYLDLDGLSRLAELNRLQIGTLGSEFGGIDPNDWPLLQPILRFRNLLLPQWQRRLSGETGLPLRDSGLVSRMHLLHGDESDAARNLQLLRARWPRLTARLEIHVVPAREKGRRPDREAPARQLTWSLYDQDQGAAPVHTWSVDVYQRSLHAEKGPGKPRAAPQPAS